MTRKPLVLASLALSLLAGCGATNTGNPQAPEGPEGIDFVRSPLSREVEPDVAAGNLETLGQGNRAFAFDLYAQLADDSDNLFLSPYSVSVALAMQYAGAETTTEEEMARALHFDLAEPELHRAFNSVSQALSGRADELIESSEGSTTTGDGFELRLVNAAFAQQGGGFRGPFLDTLALHYDAGLFAADFGDPETQRTAINDWVEAQTEERIMDLLPPGSLDGAVLVLVNAIYFKASWLTPFDPARTEDATFHAPGGEVPVRMMHGYAEPYTRGDGYAALELPYISPDVRMLFILPDEGRFEEIEAGLDRAFFDAVRTSLSRYSVTLRVPRFSFEAEFELCDAMRALGMQNAFENGAADFSDIAGAPGDLFIDGIYHKAFVALDEEGTEAAAATAVVSSVVSAPPPAEFILDRPFLFAIYDEPTGQVLFLGRLLDPS